MSSKQNELKTVLITGGTGLLGKVLTKLLQDDGYKIRYLSRSKQQIKDVEVFQWNPSKGEIELGALENLHGLIHLAGANVGEKAWTDKQRKRILDSRLDSTKLLVEELETLEAKPSAIVSASAIGYYMGQAGGVVFKEADRAGEGFLSVVTQKWENATDDFRTLNVPSTQLRIGIVLSTKGGALQKLLLPAKLFAGTHIGDGSQRMSWIHLEDVASMMKFCIESKMEGVYNAVAPQIVTNKSFSRSLRKVLGRFNIAPPFPAFILRLAMGERASLVLEDLAVSNEKIQSTGFEFKFKDLDVALKDLISRSL